jgi:photosystem II stability/assembly factor-like uncharacterized protein
MPSYSFGDGRIWYQREKFVGYSLLLPYGMTNVTDPVGALTQVREPSAAKRRRSIVADVLRGEPPLPEFQIETRLRKTLNLMFGMSDCAVNYQAHLGACDRPDNYFSSEVGLHWERSHRGDMTIDRLAKIEGDDAPIASTIPWMAEVGPVVIDFEAEFLSARTITETEAITDIAFLESECLEDCQSQEDAGENGYAVTEVLAGSPVNVANVWYTDDRGESWSECSARPFIAGMTISSVVIAGTKNNHRVIVSNGTTQAGAPAQIAYADVSTLGTTSWVTANVGSINGQYINELFLLDWLHVYAVTDDGYVYLSQDGGVTWTAKLTSAVNELWDIEAISYGSRAGSVWVVGDSNTIYFSEDYGEGWSAITGPTAGAGDNLLALALCPDGTVIIGNDAGEVYGSYDDGLSWTTLAAQGVTATSITALEAWGDTLIWMAVDLADSSSRVLRSTDGGATFRLWSLNLPTNSGVNTLFPVDANIIFAAGDPQGGTAFITRTKSDVLGTLSQSIE